MNPLDIKMMRARIPSHGRRVLGWDAAGIVVGLGAEVQSFCVGDAVFYAGSIQRDGSMQQFQAVDERLVGKKPESIDFGQAAWANSFATKGS